MRSSARVASSHVSISIPSSRSLSARGSASSSAASSSTIRMWPAVFTADVSQQWLLGRRAGHDRELDHEPRAGSAGLDRDRAAVLLDDAVGDREAEAGSRSDLLRREERVEDALLELPRDPGPAVGEVDPDQLAFSARRDLDRLGARIGEGVARVGEQVDEDLLELDRVAEHDQLVAAEVELDVDRAQPQLLLHQGQRALDHLVDVDGRERDRRGAAEGPQVRDDRRRLLHLLQGVLELTNDRLPVVSAEPHLVEDVADEQADVVERVVELVRDAGRELAERRQLAGLDELLLLLPQLLLPALHFLRGLTQVAHDVDHRLAAVAKLQVRLVRVLEDVEHRLALLAELAVRLVEVAHDVDERAPALLRLNDSLLETGDLLTQGGCVEFDLRVGVGHQPAARSRLSCRFSACICSSSFSSAIILSSRPTTTSSNFSRSRIFSCSSVLDRSRSRTTFSYSRMSRRMPMAPITLP